MKRTGEGKKRELEGGDIPARARACISKLIKLGGQYQRNGGGRDGEDRLDSNTLEECMNSENLVKRNEYWMKR